MTEITNYIDAHSKEVFYTILGSLILMDIWLWQSRGYWKFQYRRIKAILENPVRQKVEMKAAQADMGSKFIAALSNPPSDESVQRTSLSSALLNEKDAHRQTVERMSKEFAATIRQIVAKTGVEVSEPSKTESKEWSNEMLLLMTDFASAEEDNYASQTLNRLVKHYKLDANAYDTWWEQAEAIIEARKHQ